MKWFVVRICETEIKTLDQYVLMCVYTCASMFLCSYVFLMFLCHSYVILMFLCSYVLMSFLCSYVPVCSYVLDHIRTHMLWHTYVWLNGSLLGGLLHSSFFVCGHTWSCRTSLSSGAGLALILSWGSVPWRRQPPRQWVILVLLCSHVCI